MIVLYWCIISQSLIHHLIKLLCPTCVPFKRCSTLIHFIVSSWFGLFTMAKITLSPLTQQSSKCSLTWLLYWSILTLTIHLGNALWHSIMESIWKIARSLVLFLSGSSSDSDSDSWPWWFHFLLQEQCLLSLPCIKTSPFVNLNPSLTYLLWISYRSIVKSIFLLLGLAFFNHLIYIYCSVI
jgi:hypothetical protein